VAVTEFAPTVGQAVTGAADKLQRKLSAVIGKLRDKQTHGQRPDFVTEEDEVN
ncbi:MAG: ribosomal subunit interface protein, partial [Alishewanella sp. 32-51-5]